MNFEGLTKAAQIKIFLHISLQDSGLKCIFWVKKVVQYFAGPVAAVFMALILTGGPMPANAEEQKLACAEEIERHCHGVKPGGGRLLLCLKEHENDLSPACREKLAWLEKKINEAKLTCAPDIEKFCKGVRPGEGRIAKCLKEHEQDISQDCRRELHGIRKMVPEKKVSARYAGIKEAEEKNHGR